MKKVIRDGKVAVIYSPGFGAGWYTWNQDHPKIIFHPKLVEMIETNQTDKITEEWMKEELGIDDIYIGDADTLTIEWLNEGVHFRIEEYDGSESVIDLGKIDFFIA